MRVMTESMMSLITFFVVLTSIGPHSVAQAFSGTHGTSPTGEAQSYQAQSRRTSTTDLRARRWSSRKYYDEHDEDGRERERSMDRPTLPLTETLGGPVLPSKPKIVVLGASGKIGSQVVKQLMEMSELDATIVAFVRDYDKACRVLYDDVYVMAKGKRRGPQLQIVVGDLVPDEELPGFEDEDEDLWLQTAQSAASFYKNQVADYDNRDALVAIDVNEALRDAIRGCTTIISCVGSVRPTNLWSDFISRPLLRLFRKDVSGWCQDKRHPYYVHYASTRKVVGFAEREQLRREAIAEALLEDGMEDVAAQIPRIRIVRISDLCVALKPWALVPVLTNSLNSMVFRYQDMTERLLEESSLLDSVVLRPGDLVDDERDVNTTSLQVDPSGKVPCPARVGREDVAALAVAASLFHSSNATETGKSRERFDNTPRPPLHLKLGIRWAGRDLEPYPEQGHRNDGLPDAHLCMNRVLRDYRKRNKHQRRQEQGTSGESTVPDSIVRFVKSNRRRALKPYGVCVALPMYFFLGLVARSLFVRMPGYERVAPVLVSARDKASALFVAQMPSLRRWLQRIPRRGTKNFISL